MRHDTVKTEKQARAFLSIAIDNDIRGREGEITDRQFSKTNAHCECGQTQCIKLSARYNWNNDVGIIYKYCAVCEQCGSDDAYCDDVIF